MIAVISPAKSLDFDINIDCKYTMPCFLKESASLINELKKKKPIELERLMSISTNLSILNADRFNAWLLPFTNMNSKQCAFVFKGSVYKGLNIEDFSSLELAYSNKHIRILSGLYGLLRPLDLIQAYRLEMSTKLKTLKANNLYEFWGEKITKELNNELNKNKILINLASNEYFNSIKKDTLKADIITPIFKDFKNGQFKVISFYAKRARGLMCRFMAKNKLNDAEDLKKFDLEGYIYNKKLSEEKKWVFTRAA